MMEGNKTKGGCEMMYFTNTEWTPIDDNPFTSDGSYGEEWSAFIYDELINSSYTNVYHNARVYTLTVKPQSDKDFGRLYDFVIYEISYSRNVILKIPRSIKQFVLEKLTNKTKNETIRPSDPKWVVHSTTKQLWSEIKTTGALLSPNYLKNNGKIITEVGLKNLLEPVDYSDFIMLDVLNGCGVIVVNSRQLGYICLDPNCIYVPGVRIYFDAHKIIQDGLATRDGLHVIKVFERLPLDKYMIMVIDDTMLPKQTWTPTIFTKVANEYFLEYVNSK